MRNSVEGGGGRKPFSILPVKKFRVMAESQESVISLCVTGSSSQGQRCHMEDKIALAYLPPVDGDPSDVDPGKEEMSCSFLYVGVFDGHGGEHAAMFAKDKLMDHITQQPGFTSQDDELVLEAIKDGFLSLQTTMERERQHWPRTSSGYLSTAGTTASVAFIRNGKLYTGHVGDSRIVLGFLNDSSTSLDTTWEADELTTDHKPESEEEKARIEAHGGKVSAIRGVSRVVWRKLLNPNYTGAITKSTQYVEMPFLAVARSLGDFWSYNDATNAYTVSPIPDVSVTKLDPTIHRCIIFASDGVWNVLSSQDSIKCVQAHLQEEPSANPSVKLVNLALNKWDRLPARADNTTVLTIMFNNPTEDVDMISDENTSPQINTSQDAKRRGYGNKVKNGRTSQKRIVSSTITGPVSPLSKKPFMRRQSSRIRKNQSSSLLSTRNSQMNEEKMPPRPMKIDEKGKKSSRTRRVFEQLTTGVRRLTRGQSRLIRISESPSKSTNIASNGVSAPHPVKNQDSEVQIQREKALELKSRLSPDIMEVFSTIPRNSRTMDLSKSQPAPMGSSTLPSSQTPKKINGRERKSSTSANETKQFTDGNRRLTQSQSTLNASSKSIQVEDQTISPPYLIKSRQPKLRNPSFVVLTPIVPPPDYPGNGTSTSKLVRRKLSDSMDTRHPTAEKEALKRRRTIATNEDAKDLCSESRRMTRSMTKAQQRLTLGTATG